MGEHIINRNSTCQEMSGQGPGIRHGLHVARTGSKPERQWLWRPQELHKCHSGYHWCLQDKTMGNPSYFLIFGLGFWNLFAYMINLALLTSVSNDFEIRTEKSQKKWHPVTDDHWQCWGLIQCEEDGNQSVLRTLHQLLMCVVSLRRLGREAG